MAGIKTAGGKGARNGKGANDAPDDASWPASALIEMASATPSHHGAAMLPAQPIREKNMRVPRSSAGLGTIGYPQARTIAA